MHLIIGFTFFTLFFIPLPVFTAPADELLGVWVNGDGDGYIEIFYEDDEYKGKIIGSTDPNDADRLDEKNPNKKLRSRKLDGMMIMWGFNYNADKKKWVNGKIYDPNSGNTYKCKLTLKDNNTLKVRGFIGVAILGRTEIWNRSKTH